MGDNRAPDDKLASQEARIHRDAFVNSRRQQLGCVGPFLLKVNSRYREFEFHGVCGPVLVGRDGEPLKKQPGEQSDFWPAFEAWAGAGCYVDRYRHAILPSQKVFSP